MEISEGSPQKTSAKSRRCKSSTDIHRPSDDSILSIPDSMSRRKRIWKSFKRKTRIFTVKRNEQQPNDNLLSHEVAQATSKSQPNLSVRCWSRRELSEDEVKNSVGDTVPGANTAPGANHSQYHSRFAEEISSESPIVTDFPSQELNSFRVSTPIKDVSVQPKIIHTLPNGNAQTRGVELSDDPRDIDDSGIKVLDNKEAFDLVFDEDEPESGSGKQPKTSHLEHPFYLLEVILHEGKDLVVKDYCGTSDPYVKIKIAAKTVYKSQTIFKSLNPSWEERVVLPITDVLKLVQFRVYDYDRGFYDDAMGGADLDLTRLQINVTEKLKLLLYDAKGKDTYMGYLLVSCTLLPKTQDDKEMVRGDVSDSSDECTQTSKRFTRQMDQTKKLKMQIWSGIVSIVLVEGRDLLPMDENGTSDPYVKFKLGSEKYRSKHKSKTLNPRWLEQFDLRIFDDNDQSLEICVYDKDSSRRDDFMGRTVIDLLGIVKEKTHTIEQALEDGAGFVKILLTITGTQGGETITDLMSYTPNPNEREDLVRKYGLLNSFWNMKDVGWLQVKVFQAQGLAAADFSGKSDPFCVIELVNARLQTQTEYKTLNPEWNKVFTFNVKDIHSILEVTVYDEDRDKTFEFLGRIALPILGIRCRERKWYILKDKKLHQKAKGTIQLEFDFIFNSVKAAVRSVNPREQKFMHPEPKLKIPVMKRNIERVSRIATAIMESVRFMQSCFEWESRSRSATAFLVFLVAVWFFEIYMLPCTLLLLFFKNYMVRSLTGSTRSDPNFDQGEFPDEDEDEDEEDKEERKTIRSKLASIQEVCLQVQQAMETIASLGEQIKNMFNWTVPWVTMLAVILLTFGAIILYFIPLRYLILAWGINKFTKKLRAPNAIPNNELLDLLSRVPNDYELSLYKELKPDGTSTRKKKTS